ncbi:hypothetical protein N5E30_23505, partial [Pseudomonas chengduensis]
ATKAVVKKSGKIAEAPPSTAAGWKPSIFLDFEGARTPALVEGQETSSRYVINGHPAGLASGRYRNILRSLG